MATLTAKLVDGSVIEFDDQPIGSGGEKVVFYTKDRQAVVCFFLNGLTDRCERRQRLDKILHSYNPTTGAQGEYWKAHFCWPIGLLDGDGSLSNRFLRANNIIDPPLAVVAPAYRQNFFFRDRTGAIREKNGKWFTSEKPRRLLPPEEKGNFLTYLQVCTKMARAVRRMHFAGLAHSDLSNKNVLIDPRHGDACIIDIDSLVVPGVAPPSVLGTPGYIAPEVVAGKGMPRIETDCHALAVLIYENLLLRHPLRGPKVNSQTSPEEDEKLSVGEKAVFIEHPTDKSNAPKPPPPIPMIRLGSYLSELFLRVFTQSLHAPNQRPGAAAWETALYRTFDLLHPSPGGAEWFVLSPGMPMQCPFTSRKLTAPVPFIFFYSENKPGNFVRENHTLTVYQDLSLMPWHTRSKLSPSENVDRTRQGYFSLHQGHWHLVSESDNPMQVVNGPKVSKGQSVEITRGLQLRASLEPNGRLFVFDFMKP
jgi:serine/threonine protein kinase